MDHNILNRLEKVRGDAEAMINSIRSQKDFQASVKHGDFFERNVQKPVGEFLQNPNRLSLLTAETDEEKYVAAKNEVLDVLLNGAKSFEIIQRQRDSDNTDPKGFLTVINVAAVVFGGALAFANGMDFQTTLLLGCGAAGVGVINAGLYYANSQEAAKISSTDGLGFIEKVYSGLAQDPTLDRANFKLQNALVERAADPEYLAKIRSKEEMQAVSGRNKADIIAENQRLAHGIAEGKVHLPEIEAREELDIPNGTNSMSAVERLDAQRKMLEELQHLVVGHH